MAEATSDRGPAKSSGNGDVSGQSSSIATDPVAVAPAAAGDAESIQVPAWTKALGWCATAGLIYLLICAVSVISRGVAGLTGDAAHSMFAFAENPWVGLSVGVLGTVLIQSSTTTRAIAVTAVGSGALPWVLLVEEAGGRFTDRTGGHASDQGGGLYSNANLHSQWLASLDYPARP